MVWSDPKLKELLKLTHSHSTSHSPGKGKCQKESVNQESFSSHEGAAQEGVPSCSGGNALLAEGDAYPSPPPLVTATAEVLIMEQFSSDLPSQLEYDPLMLGIPSHQPPPLPLVPATVGVLSVSPGLQPLPLHSSATLTMSLAPAAPFANTEILNYV